LIDALAKSHETNRTDIEHYRAEFRKLTWEAEVEVVKGVRGALLRSPWVRSAMRSKPK
jgi:hypothetical protein